MSCRSCTKNKETGDASCPGFEPDLELNYCVNEHPMPFEARVVHVLKDSFEIYIGRANQSRHLKRSKWANPYKIGRDGSREEVIRKYERWLLKQPELMAALPELRGKILGCWCSPQACHGDVLLRLAYSEVGRGRK